MVDEERKINLHGTVKEKTHYKSYRIEPKSWRYIITNLTAGIFLLFVFVAIRIFMEQAFDTYIVAFGSLGLMVIFALLSYALFRQYKKRKH